MWKPFFALPLLLVFSPAMADDIRPVIRVNPLSDQSSQEAIRVRITPEATIPATRPRAAAANGHALTSPFERIIVGKVRPFADVEAEEDAETDFRTLPRGKFYQSPTNRQNFLITNKGVHRAKIATYKRGEEPEEGDLAEFPAEGNAAIMIPHQYQGGGAWASLPEVQQYDAIVQGRDPFEQVQQEVTQRRSDPLILDLEGDGIRLIGPDRLVRFDVNGDGFAELTGWTAGADDGLLCLDRNRDGAINNGNELFGLNRNNTSLGNGFEVLKVLDTNKDNVFDSKDTEYLNVRVWRDLDRNAVAQSHELNSLPELGIISFDLKYSNDEFYIDEKYNMFKERSTFTRLTKAGALIDLDVVNVWFANHIVR